MAFYFIFLNISRTFSNSVQVIIIDVVVLLGPYTVVEWLSLLVSLFSFFSLPQFRLLFSITENNCKIKQKKKRETSRNAKRKKLERWFYIIDFQFLVIRLCHILFIIISSPKLKYPNMYIYNIKKAQEANQLKRLKENENDKIIIYYICHTIKEGTNMACHVV